MTSLDRVQKSLLNPGGIALITSIVFNVQAAIAEDKMQSQDPLMAQCCVVSKLFYKAGITMSKYSNQPTPELAKEYAKIRQEIPDAVSKLKEVSGKGPAKEVAFKKVETISTSGLKMYDAAKKTIDEKPEERALYFARHLSKDIRGLTDEIQDGLFALTKA